MDNQPIDQDGLLSIKGGTILAAGSSSMGGVTASTSQTAKTYTGTINSGAKIVASETSGSQIMSITAPKAANFLYFNHKNELHKVAFVTIISFGVICAFITPILITPDEVEHLMRSLLTSQGNLFPQYVQMIPANASFSNLGGLSIDSTEGFIDLVDNLNQTFFNSTVVNIPINNAHAYFYTAFLHNPFYGYLAQGFGILLANILHLNNI